MIVDLSHPLHNGMPSYPGVAPIEIQDSTRRAFHFTSFVMGANTGTYVDAPRHRYEHGADFVDLPLERLADLAGVVFDVAHMGAITPETFAESDFAGKAVLLCTGWSSRWGYDDYFRSHHFLAADAATRLAEGGAAMVGIDCANIDDMDDAERPAHTILLGAGIPIVEHMGGLEQLLHVGTFRMFAVPPAVRGGTSFPVRAFAIVPTLESSS